MKEEKVYVDELPKGCTDCPCRDSEYNECNLLSERHHIGYYDETGWRDVPVTEDFKEISCPFIDIKTYNRELVKEVCEKIREIGLQYNIEDLSGVFISYKALDQIQKEYEK